jgi:glutaredoxin
MDPYVRLSSRRRVMEATLELYVDKDCPGCARARRYAQYVQEHFPRLEVRIIDLEESNIHERPSSIFTVPTYLLNGKMLSLGNPKLEDLLEKIEGVLGLR